MTHLTGLKILVSTYRLACYKDITMKKVDSLLSNVKHLNIKPDLEQSINHAGLDIQASKMVNFLFKILERHITYFRLHNQSQEDLDFTKREWTLCFMAHNLTRDMFEIGISKLRTSLEARDDIKPAEFISLCKHEIKPQTDTRPEWMKQDNLIESDEHKEQKKQNARIHINAMLDSLK